MNKTRDCSINNVQHHANVDFSFKIINCKKYSSGFYHLQWTTFIRWLSRPSFQSLSKSEGKVVKMNAQVSFGIIDKKILYFEPVYLQMKYAECYPLFSSTLGNRNLSCVKCLSSQWCNTLATCHLDISIKIAHG